MSCWAPCGENTRLLGSGHDTSAFSVLLSCLSFRLLQVQLATGAAALSARTEDSD